MAETHPNQAAKNYRIVVKGTLDNKWADWFNGLSITVCDNGETCLAGPIVDQSALLGILATICDLGLVLRLVELIEAPACPAPVT